MSEKKLTAAELVEAIGKAKTKKVRAPLEAQLEAMKAESVERMNTFHARLRARHEKWIADIKAKREGTKVVEPEATEETPVEE